MEDEDGEINNKDLKHSVLLKWVQFSPEVVKFCPKCGQNLEKNLDGLEFHFKNCLRTQEYKMLSKLNKFVCKNCSKCFAHKGHFNSHIFYCDPNAQIQDFDGKDIVDKLKTLRPAAARHINDGVAEDVRSSKNSKKCPTCDKLFSSQRYLEIHASIHTGVWWTARLAKKLYYY